jgi:hypothetical protein
MTNLPVGDRFPGCLRMDLEIQSIQSEQPFKQVDLVLHIRFGEHQEEIKRGTVTFGLKRGQLKVQLTNGQVPLKNYKLKNDFQTVIEKEIQAETGTGKQSGVQLVAKNPGLTASSQATTKTSDKVKYQEYQVTTRGDDNTPTWIFEVKTDKEVLEGLLQNTTLATIDVQGKSCSLIATFEITKPQDICITDAQLLWVKNISDKKKKIIAAKVRRLFLEQKLEPISYLSRVELSYG